MLFLQLNLLQIGATNAVKDGVLSIKMGHNNFLLLEGFFQALIKTVHHSIMFLPQNEMTLIKTEKKSF